jgi:hypothetical protein
MSQAQLPTSPPTLRGDDDVDAIPPALLNGVGVGGLLAVLFWMLATGRLVTRREHEGRIADKDQVIATQERTIAVKDSQLEKLAVVGETAIRILSSVEALAKERK